MLTSPLFIIPVLAAAILDIAWRRIPNWLTGGLVLLFLPAAWLWDLSLAEFGWHILAGAIFLGFGLVMHVLGLIGGGDAKFATAIALWVGIGKLLPFLMLTALCGGLLALVYVLLRFAGYPRTSLPYGVAIACAGLLAGLPHLTGN